MPTARRLATLALITFCVLTAPGFAPTPDPSDAWQRLRAMPPELRAHLAEQLKEFHALDRAEQESVRDLDRKIASEPEENREIYYAVLRRYHLWLHGLPETQRNQLAATPSSKRISLVSKLFAARKDVDKSDSSFYHYSDFGGASPFDLAQRIKVWLLLTDDQKTAITNLPAGDRPKRMTKYVRELKIQVPRPSVTESDELYKRAMDSGRFPYLKKVEETKKQANIKHRFVDNYYFVKHPPAKVGPEKLLQFERALPVWVRGGFDTLPPEEARRRLTILYRLVFPNGEMGASGKAQAPPPPSRPADASPPAPRPSASSKPGPASGPF